jgi:hypothetical protein
MEFSLGHGGDDDLPAHDLALQVGIGVVLSDVVTVGGYRFMGGELSSQTSKSRWRPPSSSLMKTLAVMCMALTRQSPSWIPDSLTISET